MVALKKLSFTIFGLLFLLPSVAQEKGDIGFIFSNSWNSKLALEYRKPFKEKFKFKIAATYGEWGNYFSFNNGEIISATDSTVVERDFNRHIHQAGLRFGLERQFGNSLFSVGTDVIVDYRRTRSSYRNRTISLQSNGTWEQGSFTTIFPPFSDPSDSHIVRHYLVTGARLNFNMDIPIGKSFLLNLSTAGIFGLPVYMGATQIQDPTGEFMGTPPSVINLDVNFGIGLRYKIGSRNKA
jgi:hypothetical protein